jgi:hypothetical protein
MVQLAFSEAQWEYLVSTLIAGQGALASALEDLQGQLAALQSINAEQLIVLQQIRDKLPEV